MVDELHEFMKKNDELRREASKDQRRIDTSGISLKRNTEMNNFSYLIETAMRSKQRKGNA